MKTLTLIVSLLLISQTALPASTCPNWPLIFQKNRQEEVKKIGKRVLVGAFENRGHPTDDWLAESFYFVLSDYFQLMKKFEVIKTNPDRRFQTTLTKDAIKAGKLLGADYVIYGFLKRDRDNPTLKVYARFIDVKKESEFAKKSWSIEFPKSETLFNLYLHIANEGYTYFSKGKKTAYKLMLPYRHESRSLEALMHYSIGRSLLETGRPDEVNRAVKSFSAAIRSDYNYVQAYLGHAEALVMRSFMNKIQGEAHHGDLEVASRDLTKASLLHPPFTKRFRGIIDRYLEADSHQTLALSLINKNDKKAQLEFKRSLSILHGDIYSMQKLKLADPLKELDPCR